MFSREFKSQSSGVQINASESGCAVGVFPTLQPTDAPPDLVISFADGTLTLKVRVDDCYVSLDPATAIQVLGLTGTLARQQSSDSIQPIRDVYLGRVPVRNTPPQPQRTQTERAATA